MSNLVEIIITAKNLAKPAFDSVAADSKILSSTMGKMGVGAAAALVGIGIESVKMASTFQQQVTRLGTQAGVSKQAMGEISKGVLDLAGQVGFSPLSLAKSAYYVESNFSSMGITTKQALALVKIAAEGAAVGGSDLVDTTTALNATVASGIPGVQDYSKAMGALNAIVGSGEMTMSDLVKALGTGVLAVVKGYGLSITDVGAALTTFGDNNIRGAVAATDLRMAVQALAVPAKGATAYLKEFGWTTKTMRDDMQNHGLVYVLDELHAKFVAAGISAKEQGGVITEMFGKKAGAGLAVLLGNMDRVDSKVPALQGAMNSFAGAWAQQKQTFSQQMKDISAGFDAMMIKLGTLLIPKVSEFITLLQTKGAPVAHAFAAALSGIGSGFMGIAAPAAVPTAAVGGGRGHLQAGAGTQAPLDVLMGGRGHLQAGAGGTAALPPPNLTVWQKVGAVLRGVANDFKTFVGQVATAFGNLLKAVQPTLVILGGAFLLALKAVGIVLATVIGPALVAVTGFLKQHQAEVAGVLIGYAAYRAAILAVTVAQGIWTGATKIAAIAQAAFNLVMDANPIALVVIGIAALAAGIIWVATKTTWFQTAWKYTWNFVKTVTMDVFNFLTHGFGQLALLILGPIGVLLILANNWKTVWHFIESIAVGIWQTSLKPAFDGMVMAFHAVASAGDWMWNSVLKPVFHFLLDAFMNVVSFMLRGGADMFGWVPGVGGKLKAAASNFDILKKSADAMFGSSTNGVNNLSNAISNIPNKTVTITFNGVNQGSLAGSSYTSTTGFSYAHGGIAAAATGGARSGMVWVGEQGPELVKLPTGSTVVPSGQSRAMAARAGGGGGGGGGGGTTVLEVHSGGSRLDDLLVEIIRHAVRVRGGDVQTAFGQN